MIHHAIDMHTHINHFSPWDSQEQQWYTAQLQRLIEMNKAAGIEKMFCSTFASVLNAAAVEHENVYMHELAESVDCLYQWVVIDPRNNATFEQAEKMLSHPKCVGIKLHPSNHKYELEVYAHKVFSFASVHRATVLIHPKAEADYILPMASKYPEVNFIMAHMWGKPHVDAIEYAEYGNVYADTSGSASQQNLIIEYAVERVGSERILFGTDTYAPGAQKGRIEYALIDEKYKLNILRNNAIRLFGI